MTTVTVQCDDNTTHALEIPEWRDGHDVEWSINGYWVEAKVSCASGEGSWCRLACAEECGAETWPCESWEDGTDGPREHVMRDGGHCGVLPFFDEGDEAMAELYDGKSHALVSGPVQIRWDGATYRWRYPEGGAS